VLYADLVGTEQAPHTTQAGNLGRPNVSFHFFFIFFGFSFSFSAFSFYVF
jgi:hypothetical protein